MLPSMSVVLTCCCPQIFNQFNARKIKDEYNILGGIWQSRMFLYVAVIILAFQVAYSVPLLNLCRLHAHQAESWLRAPG